MRSAPPYPYGRRVPLVPGGRTPFRPRRRFANHIDAGEDATTPHGTAQVNAPARPVVGGMS